MQNPKLQLENYLKSLGYAVKVDSVPEGKNGDFGCAVFGLAKEKGVNPAELGAEIASKISSDLPAFLASVEGAGPFVNFVISDSGWGEFLAQEIKFENDNPQKIVVDYGGENVAKPQSIGHLRSNILGQSFVNIAKELGHETISDNHLGDWGTQFGKLLVAIEKWGKWEEIEAMEIVNEKIEELLRLYTKFHVEAEEDEELVRLARAYFYALTLDFRYIQILEIGDKKLICEMEDNLQRAITELEKKGREIDSKLLLRVLNKEKYCFQKWKKICEWTIENLKKTYVRLGINYDHFCGEAFYFNKMDRVIAECELKNLTQKNEDGSLAIVPPEESKLPSFLIQKSDGATLYHTSDLAAIDYRLKEFAPDRIVYFVAEPQSLHFRQLFWLADKLWGCGEKCVHAKFGLVRLPEGKMSTRGGNIIRLSEMLDEAKSRAMAVLEEKKPDLPESEWDSLAEKIGVGAVIFQDLVKDRTKDIVFDWDKALSFEGQSAPYIMYTHARACSVLRKAEVAGEMGKVGEGEKKLLKELMRFEEEIGKAFSEYKPSFVAQWVYDLAVSFNKFYANCPILKADSEEEMKMRIYLTEKTRDYLAKGLGLLGIYAPEKM